LNFKIPQTGFSRGVAILGSGTAIAQVVTMLAAPLLTRLFQPKDFGVLAVYVSLLGICGVISSLMYHLAIPLPREDAEAANILILSIFFVVCTSVFVAILTKVLSAQIISWTKAPALKPFLWLLPVGVLGLGASEVLTQWAIRKKSFSIIAKTNIAKGAAQVGTQLGAGIIGLGPIGLIVGQLLGQTTGTSSLARDAIKNDWKVIRRVSYKTLCNVASRYRRFPIFSSSTSMLNAISVNAPAVILSTFFGGTITGYYSLGVRVLGYPAMLLAKSSSQVFFATAAEAKRVGKIAEETKSVLDKLIQIAAPLSLLLAVSAPEVFSVVFGNKWREAGVYTQLLTPWLFLTCIAYPIAPLTSILERQSIETLFQAILLVGRIGSLLLGCLIGDAMIGIALFGAGSALSWFGYLIWLLKISENSVSDMLNLLFRRTFGSIPFVLPVIIFKLLGISYFIVTVCATICGVGIIVFIMNRFGYIFSRQVEESLK
jgi:O-antigen/teichoic acid export membrane protein